MDRWSILGVVMILVGLVVLFVEWRFIVKVLVTLLNLLAVAIGVILILGGVAAVLFGGRWRRRKGMWGPTTTAT